MLLLDKIDFYIAKARKRNETYFKHLNDREFNQEILTKVSSGFKEMEIVNAYPKTYRRIRII